jgi:DUF917 family protein
MGSLKTEQDCEDLVRGCVIYGTGGGGDPKKGLKLLLNALDEGLALEWIDVEDIPDDTWTCSPFGMGSIAPLSPETAKEMKKFGLFEKTPNTSVGRAVAELAEFVGVEISALVPVELGGSNTVKPLVEGSRLGIPVVDGDYAGRAVPEEIQGTPYLYGKDGFPQASVDGWGNVVIIKHACNPFMLERVGKMISVAAFTGCDLAGTLLIGREMKEVVVKGTITKSLGLGRTIREAIDRGYDPIRRAVEYTEGWLLFEGDVVSKDWEDRDGYMFGTTVIKGSGGFAGRTMEIWFKNENHVSWIDGKPFVCSPDLICILENSTGEGLTNTVLDVGHDVAVLGIRGLEAFRSDRGLASAGPRYFGFDIEYAPIEDIMGWCRGKNSQNPAYKQGQDSRG